MQNYFHRAISWLQGWGRPKGLFPRGPSLTARKWSDQTEAATLSPLRSFELCFCDLWVGWRGVLAIPCPDVFLVPPLPSAASDRGHTRCTRSRRWHSSSTARSWWSDSWRRRPPSPAVSEIIKKKEPKWVKKASCGEKEEWRFMHCKKRARKKARGRLSRV